MLALATALVAALALGLGSGGWDWQLIVTLRAPRVAAAAGVGSLLALAGLSLQVLLRNPLADPYVLGHSTGASVGALAALLLGVQLWIGAAAGALVAGLALLWLARPALAAADDASPRLILLGAMLAADLRRHRHADARAGARPAPARRDLLDGGRPLRRRRQPVEPRAAPACSPPGCGRAAARSTG